MTTDEHAVLDALTGRRRPITQAALAFGLAIPVRAVQSAIESLRLSGHPILSSGDGMSLSDDPEEVAACARALSKRALNQWMTARAMRRAARTLRRDPRLWGPA